MRTPRLIFAAVFPFALLPLLGGDCEDGIPSAPDAGPACLLDDDCGDPALVCRERACVPGLVVGEGEGEGEGSVVGEGEGEGEGETPQPEGVLEAQPPGDLEFGATRLGVPVERTLTLHNSGDAPLSIVQISLSGRDAARFAVTPSGAVNTTLQPGEDLGLLLTLTPDDGLPDEAHLLVLHSGRDSGTALDVRLFGEFKGVSTLSITGEPAALSPDVTDVDFGNVPRGESRALTLFVRNDGASDSVLGVQELTVTPTNAGFAVTPLPAGSRFLSSWDGLCAALNECPTGTAACTLGVCVDAAGTPIDAIPVTITFAPTAAGAATATVTLRTDVGGVPNSATEITVRGTAVDGNLTVTPGALTFDNVFVGRPVRGTLTARNEGGAAVTLQNLSLLFGTADFAIDTRGVTLPHTIAPGGELPVDIVFVPSIAGRTPDALVWDVASGNDVQTSIVGTARLAPVARIEDEQKALIDVGAGGALAFGDLYVGTQRARTIRLLNVGPAASTLSINRMTIDGPSAARFAFTPSSFSNALGGTTTAGEPHNDLTVTYLPSVLTGADDTATLVLETDDPDHARIELPLSGRAIRPVILVDPTAIDFGPILVGTTPSPTRTVTIRNDGFGPLVITSIAAPSATAFVRTTSLALPATLAPLATMTATVTFTPTTAAVVSSSLEIVSTDVARPTVSISLVGSGGACPPRANASVVVNGSQCTYTCNTGFHACGDSCLSNTSADSCGNSCTPCDLRTGANRTCIAASSTCSYACSTGNADLNNNLSVAQGTSTDGCEYACPVSPTRVESCNNLDDDCDGSIDDGLSRDSLDNSGGNDVCAGATRISDAIEGGSTTITASIYPFPGIGGSDEDWYIVKAKEQSNTCFPLSDENFRTVFTLSGIPAGSDYDLFVHEVGSCSTALGSSQASGNANDSVTVNFTGTCAITDDVDFLVRVKRFSGGSCANYTLKVAHSQL